MKPSVFKIWTEHLIVATWLEQKIWIDMARSF